MFSRCLIVIEKSKPLLIYPFNYGYHVENVPYLICNTLRPPMFLFMAISIFRTHYVCHENKAKNQFKYHTKFTR